MRAAYPAVGRLLNRPDFLAAATGRRFHTGRMTLQARRRGEDEAPSTSQISALRVGFTVTKRVGHATERNRIRRRLRNAVAEAATSLRGEPVDVVVIGRREALQAPFPTLIDDLTRGLRVVMKPPSAPRDPARADEPRSQPRPRT